MTYSHPAYSQSLSAKSQRPLALVFILLLHIGAIVGLSSGLDLNETFSHPTEYRTRVLDAPPPVEQPKIEPVPIAGWRPTSVVSPPVIDTAIDESNPPPTRTLVVGPTTGKVDPTIATPLITAVQIDSRHPLTQPPYPSISRRLGETGTIELALYVLADGRVGEARIARSSGFARLDAAAVREALRTWRLQPARNNGEALAAWYRIAVTFHLQQ